MLVRLGDEEERGLETGDELDGSGGVLIWLSLDMPLIKFGPRAGILIGDDEPARGRGLKPLFCGMGANPLDRSRGGSI